MLFQIKNRTPLFERITITHVLVLGLFFRLLAVIFSRGYAFHDDHFEMAELVQRWREGISFFYGQAVMFMCSA